MIERTPSVFSSYLFFTEVFKLVGESVYLVEAIISLYFLSRRSAMLDPRSLLLKEKPEIFDW